MPLSTTVVRNFGLLALVQLAQMVISEPEAATPAGKKFFEIDQTLAVVISVVVVLVVIIIAVVLICCCFIDFCPLYWTCRKEAKCDYIAQPGESTLLSMPTESADGANVYHPCEAAAKFV